MADQAVDKHESRRGKAKDLRGTHVVGNQQRNLRKHLGKCAGDDLRFPDLRVSFASSIYFCNIALLSFGRSILQGRVDLELDQPFPIRSDRLCALLLNMLCW